LDFVNPAWAPDGKVDFPQDFFGREALPTASGQLNAGASCLALTRVHAFGPTYRGETSTAAVIAIP